MDEEDGRPGALAAQTGHLDATDDVPALSLHPRQSDPPATLKTVILSLPSDESVGNHTSPNHL